MSFAMMLGGLFCLFMICGGFQFLLEIIAPYIWPKTQTKPKVYQDWTVSEQIFEDAATGLTIQFEVAPDGEQVLRLYGDGLPCGNRQYNFSEGQMVGTGTCTKGLCKAGWLTKVDDDATI